MHHLKCSEIANTVTYNYHIGLSYDAFKGGWVWTDGSPVGYANWDPLVNATLTVSPSGFLQRGTCARASATSGYWMNEDCDSDGWLWAMCERMPVSDAAPQPAPADAAPQKALRAL